MFTPQQIDQISFGRATFGGYDMQQVDEFLEPLTEDYVTLYKENALLKSKMRVLVGKLEEYRKNEVAMKEAVANAQKTADKMVHDAQVKAAELLNNAAAAAAPAAAADGSSDEQVAAANAKVVEARKVASARIERIQQQMRECIQALDRIKNDAAPSSDAVADEIAQNLAALVGTTEESAPKAEPKHPTNDTTTSRFANLNLQFGRNYDPHK